MKNQILNLPFKSSFAASDFIVAGANEKAYSFLIDQEIIPDGTLQSLIFLYGDKASGKTHLAHLWQEKYRAVFFNDLLNKPLDDIFDYLEDKNYAIIEDLDDILTEAKIFHIINFFLNNKKALLITASSAPNKLDLSLNDLKSRLNSFTSVKLEKPDEELLSMVMMKHFSDRQLRVAPDVIKYILTRIERSFVKVKNIVDLIDCKSLEEKRNVTIPFVRKLVDG